MDRNKKKLLSREMGNPSSRLFFVFLLISAIPVLTLIYILRATLTTGNSSLSEMGPIFFFAALIMALGYVIGYKIIKHMVRKIMDYAAKAKRSDELKSSFAMALAHDLKSPLLVIKANISNLKTGFLGPLTPKQEETIHTCRDVADRMNALIMGLINTYKIEARIAEPSKSFFDLREAVREQLRECEAIASTKKIALSGDLCSQGLSFEGDRAMILRAIHNLLSNAIKYTPSGGRVTIKAFSEKGFVRVDCLNNGPAIPKDKLEKIFDKFERLDGSVEGEGLGLAITKDIVELHKGRIWAENVPWGLNCFTILLPLSPEP